MSTASGVQVEDVLRLQRQVDQLKERLDWVTQMLPVVNFVQDFFQKVECEASMQLGRLKQAQSQDGSGCSEEQVSNAQLETVKWLHFVTHALMTQSCAPVGLPEGHDSGSFQSRTDRDRWRHSTSSGASAAEYRGAALPPRSTQPGMGYPSHGTPTLPLVSPAGGMLSHDSPTKHSLEAQVRASSFLQRQPQVDRGFSGPAHFGASSTSPGVIEAFPAQRTSPGHSPPSVSASPALKLASPHPSSVEPRMVSPRTPAQHNAFEAVFMQPGTGGTEGYGSEIATLDGLHLGRGSWAAAYRQAGGARREALRLLCRTSIVTARELADDLTVVSQEHIDECIEIAASMLKTWTMDMWVQQPEEAKKYFEASLTAMYQHKFGEQKVS